MDRLKYHEAAVELLPVRPTFSPERLKLLDNIEQNQNITLPASLKEWYALDGAEAILGDHSDHDMPYDLLHRFGNLVVEGCLHIQGQEVGCWDWVLPLNGLDDPPVYEDDGNAVTRCSDTFSNWIYCRIWDVERTHYGLYHPMWRMNDRFPTIKVGNRNCPPPLPRRVLETFTLDRVDYPDGRTVYRYYRGKQYLRVLEGRYYYVTGETETDLEETLRELIIAGVPLEALTRHDSRRPSPAQRVLNKLSQNHLY